MSHHTHHVRLNITPFGHSCTVELDGLDISGAVRSVDISAAVHDATSITLRLVVLDGVVVEGQTRVMLPQETVDALCALGWTPPPSAFDNDPPPAPDGRNTFLPAFPVDDSTLDLLERAMTIQPGCDSTSVGDTLRMLSELGGSDTDAVAEVIGDEEDGIRVMRDPQYHEHDVIHALIAEVRRLRA